MAIKNKHIVMLGCFDTKGEDFTYLYECLKGFGEEVLTINTGVMETIVDFPIAFGNEMVSEHSGTSLATIRKSNDRGKAVKLMGQGAAKVISDLVENDMVKGIIGMGGGGGTYIALKGRVPCKVEGAIKKGQRLVAGSNGSAVAANNSNDVFAVALESNADTGVKTIEVLVL